MLLMKWQIRLHRDDDPFGRDVIASSQVLIEKRV